MFHQRSKEIERLCPVEERKEGGGKGKGGQEKVRTER